MAKWKYGESISTWNTKLEKPMNTEKWNDIYLKQKQYNIKEKTLINNPTIQNGKQIKQSKIFHNNKNLYTKTDKIEK